MKKQFQILSTAITILLFSCGKHNAEIPATITKRLNELSTNSSSAHNDPDLLLIDSDGQIRFNAELEDRPKKLQDKPSGQTGAFYTIDRSGLTENSIKINLRYIVN